MPSRIFVLISTALILSACASPTPYAPLKGRYGFSERQIEDNRFRVNFGGNYSTARETVENYLLFRAAELTLENGYDYFIVTKSDTEAKTTYAQSSYYPAYYGRFEHSVGASRHHQHFPYHARGVDWAYSKNGYVEGYTQYASSAFIMLHYGEKPDGDPHAFDARQVIENLKSFVETER